MRCANPILESLLMRLLQLRLDAQDLLLPAMYRSYDVTCCAVFLGRMPRELLLLARRQIYAAKCEQQSTAHVKLGRHMCKFSTVASAISAKKWPSVGGPLHILNA